ncbi:MAG: hypothetical protein K9W43_13060 [Candidatus Thorarchaeota archaeon]|nr:hypothetical protein [Candidatus Thorarchaeota archaeon]
MASLKKQFKEEVMTGKIGPIKFFRLTDRERIEELLDVARWVIKNISYRKHRMIVSEAFELLAVYRDVSALPKLRSLRKVWKSVYLGQYGFLYALLKHAEEGGKCNCSIYGSNRFNTPPNQEDLEQLSYRKSRSVSYDEVVTVRCKICGQKWRVQIDHSYHYPHSYWRKIK